MQHPIPPSNISLPESQKHAKIRPITQSYLLQDTSQFRLTRLKKMSISYPKSSRFRKLSKNFWLVWQNESSYQPLTQFRKTLKAQKLLSQVLYLVFDPQCFEKWNRLFFPRVKSLSCLSSLKLDYLTSCNPEFFRSLFMGEISLKKLKTFKFSLSFSQPQCRKNLPGCFKFFKRIRTLVNLSLTFRDYFEAPYHVLSNLKRCTQLRALEIEINGTDGLDHFVSCLASIFPKLYFLKKFSLSLTLSTRIQNSSLHQLFSSMQNLKTLSSLRFQFSEGEYIEFHPNLCLEFVNPVQLQEFSFDVNFPFNKKKLIQFSQALKKLQSLKNLQLSFRQCNRFTQSAMLEFSTTLSSLVLIETLDLSFSSGDKNRPIVREITPALKSLQELVFFKLGLGQNIMSTYDDIEQLFTSLKYLKSLRSLVIVFPIKIGITDGALEILSQSLAQLVFLKSLRLSFKNTKSITNHGKEVLTQAIQNLNELSSLVVSPRTLCQADGNSISKIEKTMQNFPISLQ